MKRRRSVINLIALILFVNLLTNATAWTFHSEVFTHELYHHSHAAHELDHHHHTSLMQTENIEYHHDNDIADDEILDSIMHLSLHATGQYQPFYFILSPTLPAVIGKEVLAEFILSLIPELILDSPLRPPR